MNSLVSIIIPTYNRAHLIGETLDSILSQTYQNWECVVIDDGSTDQSPSFLEEYVEKDSRFRYYDRPKQLKKGANVCRNYGFEKSKGTFIQWFDDDDVMLPNYLKDRVENFEANTQFVIGTGFYVDENLLNQKPISITLNNSLYKDYFLWKAHILTPSVVFRKSFLDDKKLFLPFISRGQETELFSRLFFEMNEMAYKIIETPSFLYRLHSASKTGEQNLYKPQTTYSKLYIATQNLSRGFLCKDKDVIQSAFDTAIHYFKLACTNKDIKNINFSIDQIPEAIGVEKGAIARKLRFWMRLYTIPFFQRHSINKRMINCIGDVI